MEDHKVIRYLENHGYIDDAVKDSCIKAIKELHEYRAIGTVEEFKALKEKSVAKKPKKKNSNKVIFTQDSYAYCPHCKNPVQIWNRSCEKCGGELDWH
jgi:hypothetical protein